MTNIKEYIEQRIRVLDELKATHLHNLGKYADGSDEAAVLDERLTMTQSRIWECERILDLINDGVIG